MARVVDVERATGVFDSLDALNSTLLLLHRLASEGQLSIRRCKDAFFAHKIPSGYRDVKLFVEVSGTGFIGELQLNLRRILQIKDVVHKFYDVERALDDEDALRRAIVGLDIESEQIREWGKFDPYVFADTMIHLFLTTTHRLNYDALFFVEINF